MSDEGLREIQLNGKQLVFLFMASTVVAVVIFLCGVMVGRGVRAQRASELTQTLSDADTDPTVATPTPLRATSSPSSSSSTPVVPARETLTYPDRLDGPEPPDESFKGPAARAAVTVSAPASPAAKPAADVALVPANPVPAKITPAKAEALKSAASAVSGEPGGNGFVVQVAAVNDRREAELIARRLAGKGYPSFVTTPGAGTPSMFRVRIGKYRDRSAAQSIATRLEKEEQFKPWITR